MSLEQSIYELALELEDKAIELNGIVRGPGVYIPKGADRSKSYGICLAGPRPRLRIGVFTENKETNRRVGNSDFFESYLDMRHMQVKYFYTKPSSVLPNIVANSLGENISRVNSCRTVYGIRPGRAEKGYFLEPVGWSKHLYDDELGFEEYATLETFLIAFNKGADKVLDNPVRVDEIQVTD